MAKKKGTIITDVNGGTLKLTSNKLIEVTGQTGNGFYLRLREFAKALKANNQGCIRIYTNASPVACVGVRFFAPEVYGYSALNSYRSVVNGLIGCREFTPETYNKIVRAAKASVRKSRKTQTGAKALGAAAGKAKRK